MATKKPSLTTYILELRGGNLRKVTVPSNWKVTFGPLVPYTKHGGGEAHPALRFYESKEKQRAIFTDVVSFRDESIPIQERITKVKQKRHRHATPEGERDVIVEARITEWRNPDDPQDPDGEFDFAQLEDHSD